MMEKYVLKKRIERLEKENKELRENQKNCIKVDLNKFRSYVQFCDFLNYEFNLSDNEEFNLIIQDLTRQIGE